MVAPMTTNKALAIIAHGSRNNAANEEFLELVCQLAGTTREYADLRGCFLELASPSLPEAVADLVAEGHRQIDVYPLFFNQGKHVARDIPALVEEEKRVYANTEIRLLPYFGSFSGLAGMIEAHLRELGSSAAP